MEGRKLDDVDIIPFMLAGKSKFTMLGVSNRFTYYIMAPKNKGVKSQTHRFVKVMDTSRGNDFTYIGFLKLVDGRWQYIFAQPNVKRPSFNIDSLEVRAFRYVFDRGVNGIYDDRIQVWHEGKCACCGRPLTTPESLVTGWGPVCMRKMKDALSSERVKDEYLSK